MHMCTVESNMYYYILSPAILNLIASVPFTAHPSLLPYMVASHHLHGLTSIPLSPPLQYLLAMVYVYFRRANLTLDQYTRVNFFAAL